MAPKSARVVGSGSTHPSFDEESSMGFGGNKFSSPEAQAEFTRLMSKAVDKERGFLLTAQDGDLLEMIIDKSWESFCEASAAVQLSIVREFYANAKADKNGFSLVRGFTVDYRPVAIRRILNQPAKPRGAEDSALKTGLMWITF